MIAAQGMDVVAIREESANCIEYFLAARTAIDHISKEIETVGLAQPDGVFQQAAKGSGTAMNVGNHETA